MELSGGFIRERTEQQQFGNLAERRSKQSSSGAPASLQSATQLPAYPINACQDGSGCSRCNSVTFSQEFYDSFKMLICNQCRRQEKLVSKSTAKQQYGLTDGDLKKLGSVRRANPQRKDWHPMQLYLQAQVEGVSRQKHGGKGLEERQRALLDRKLQGRIRKREEEKARAAREVEKLHRFRRRVEEDAAQPSTAEAALPEVEVEQI